mgnify:CR=1 FL=1
MIPKKCPLNDKAKLKVILQHDYCDYLQSRLKCECEACSYYPYIPYTLKFLYKGQEIKLKGEPVK